MNDVLIVGAGSAGCVLANRLSADPSRRVVLLEAGPPDDAKELRIPLAFHTVLGRKFDWGYRTAPNGDPDGQSRLWPQGRVIGGSSSINAMIWMRGHRRGYDGWADGGLEGWGWDDVLPVFRSLEDHVLGESELHGAHGPVRVEHLRDPHPLSKAFLRATEEAGLRPNPDLNGERQEGAGLYHVTQRRGERWSAARAFLDDCRGRPNLEIHTEVFVRRILFREGRAVGVEVEQWGERMEILAGEVVICAGAIGSPHLLLRSGIGPGDELQPAGVEVVRDLPGVGRNLQDHPCVQLGWGTRRRTLLQAGTVASAARYHLLRKGMLTSNVAEAGAMIRLKETSEIPEIQLHFAPAFALEHGMKIPDWRGYMIGVTLVKVASRGRVRLDSSDPGTAPIIEANTFAEDSDLDHIARGVEIALEVGGQSAFDHTRTEHRHPSTPLDDRAAIADFCRREHQTLYHPVGTCAMGMDPGAGAVVNSMGRVHGVPGLRVIDASIMPTIPNSNTNAPTMMIAEKIAGEGW